jgi:hypothetical protein
MKAVEAYSFVLCGIGTIVAIAFVLTQLAH